MGGRAELPNCRAERLARSYRTRRKVVGLGGKPVEQGVMLSNIEAHAKHNFVKINLSPLTVFKNVELPH